MRTEYLFSEWLDLDLSGSSQLIHEWLGTPQCPNNNYLVGKVYSGALRGELELSALWWWPDGC